MSAVSRSGLWRCKQCNKANPDTLRRCTGCDSWGDFDWVCQACTYKNFAKRDTCKKCEAPKPAEGTGEVKQEGYQGGGVGYPSYVQPSAQAYTSYSSQPAALANSSYSSQQQNHPEIPWMCGLCNIENQPKRIVCFECSGHRERVEVRNKNYGAQPQATFSTQQIPPAQETTFSTAPVVRESSYDNYDFSNTDPYRSASPFQTIPREVSYPIRSGSLPLSTPGGKRLEDRSQDWACSSCENRNFAKRKNCNNCNKPREEVEDKSVNYSNDAPPLNIARPWKSERSTLMYRESPSELNGTEKRAEDRSKDWCCSGCQNRNFAKRDKCNRCRKPRQEVEENGVVYGNELIPADMSRKRGPDHRRDSFEGRYRKQIRSMSSDRREEDLSKDWVCGNCNINCFAKRSDCFRCKKSRSEVELRGVDVHRFARKDARPPMSIHGHSLNLRHSSSMDYKASSTKKPFVVEDRSNDWNCKFCNINNFAKRASCFKCNLSRKECEDEEGNDGGRDNNSEATELSPRHDDIIPFSTGEEVQ